MKLKFIHLKVKMEHLFLVKHKYYWETVKTYSDGCIDIICPKCKEKDTYDYKHLYLCRNRCKGCNKTLTNPLHKLCHFRHLRGIACSFKEYQEMLYINEHPNGKYYDKDFEDHMENRYKDDYSVNGKDDYKIHNNDKYVSKNYNYDSDIDGEFDQKDFDISK